MKFILLKKNKSDDIKPFASKLQTPAVISTVCKRNRKLKCDLVNVTLYSDSSNKMLTAAARYCDTMPDPTLSTSSSLIWGEEICALI